MDPRLDSIKDLIRKTEKTLDEIEWENPSDVRIEQLVKELNELKEKEANGELYEPKF